jgi:hypothetical protein
VRAAVAIAAVAALVAAGCGGEDSGDSSGEHGAVDTATATAPVEAPAETVTVPETAPPVTITAPAPAPTAPEEAPGGAGDEEGIQVPVRFVLQSGGGAALTPESAEAPAFLGLAVTVDNQDSTAHRLEVGDRGASLPAGRTTTLTLPGRAATELPVLVDGNQAATLKITAEATP